MKPNAILFVDIDETKITHYTYREPHFAAAKKMGLLCLTIARQGRPHTERLFADSDKVYLLESLSSESLHEMVLILQQTYHLRGIFCHAGHASASGQMGCIVAEICQKIGLPHAPSSSIAACNNKFLMRQALQKKGIRSIRYALCHSEKALREQAELIGYPVMVKPPFGAGSAFIKKCHNWPELQSYYRVFTAHYQHSAFTDFLGNIQTYATHEGVEYINQPGQSLLLEEYIDGIEGTVECVSTQVFVHPVLINEKLILTEKQNTVLENLLISPPVSFTATEQEQIRHYAIACIQAVGLKNAIAHLEFRMTADGPVVIEINPRLGGLFVNSAFRDLAGLDPYQLYLAILLQEKEIDSQIKQGQQRAMAAQQHYAMIALYPQNSGYFQGIDNIEYIKQNPCVIECLSQSAGCFINAETEEHYLLRCWAKVHDATHARALHDEILAHVKPIIVPVS
ncbi:MAG: ATP-grasp domain-containing protein [Enterobacteriaceae bacterium]|jgi:biotin carboxylase|nr:ATP-grasp domain-containing protein [Enterobacteriaceae bacterium]